MYIQGSLECIYGSFGHALRDSSWRRHVCVYRALLSVYRALLSVCRAFLSVCVALYITSLRAQHEEATHDALPHLPSHLLDTHNVILVGGPRENRVTNHFLQRGLLPVKFGPQVSYWGSFV